MGAIKKLCICIDESDIVYCYDYNMCFCGLLRRWVEPVMRDKLSILDTM